MKDKQPKIEFGTTFTGWAVFNWGTCLQRVFRTRKDAQDFCIKSSQGATTWNDVKGYYRVEKVTCSVTK